MMKSLGIVYSSYKLKIILCLFYFSNFNATITKKKKVMVLVLTWNQAHNNFTLFHPMLAITWWDKSYRYYLYF